MKNVADIADEVISFAGGILTIHCGWGKANRASSFSSSKIRDVVEAGL